MKTYQAIVVVVVYSFVTWMIHRGFSPYTALVTAGGALTVSMMPAGLVRYQAATWLRGVAAALEPGSAGRTGPTGSR